MRNKIVMLVLSVAVIVSLVLVGCAPEVAPPPEEGAPPPEEEEEAPPAAPEEEVITWRLQTPYPESLPHHQDLVEVCRTITKMTNGRMEFDVYPGGSIVPSWEELDALCAGTLDGQGGGTSQNIDKFGPVVDLFSQYPGGLNAAEGLAWYYMGEGVGLKYLRELYKDQNCHIVGTFTMFGAEVEMWSTVKIVNVEDYKGLKIRTYGDWGKVLVDFGASVITMASAELYPALERGVLDALEHSTPYVDLTTHFYEIAKYLHYPGVHSPGVYGNLLFINRQKWESLPDDLKCIVEVAIREQSYKGYSRDLYESGKALEFYQEQGVELVRLSDELQMTIIEKTDAMWDELAEKDPFFAEVLKSQRDLVSSLSAAKLMEPDMAKIRSGIK